MLRAAGLRCGRFTSPHLLEPRDCIAIDDRTVSSTLFDRVLEDFHSKNRAENIKASSFELLTATAFEIFHRERVDIAVVEVGMGGRLDATNVLHHPCVTVISKIGLDHQDYLGNTLADIAREKAGIMKANVACVVDSTNDQEALDAIQSHAEQVRAEPLLRAPDQAPNFIWELLPESAFEPHQQVNLSCAVTAVDLALTAIGSAVDVKTLLPAAQYVSWPGRLEVLSLGRIVERRETILLDGAHNAQSATVLASYVDRRLRQSGEPVTWVIAISQGKDVKKLLSILLRSGDQVAATEFPAVEGMPWVSPVPCRQICDSIDEAVEENAHVERACFKSVPDALAWAVHKSAGGPMVVAGSLYLVSEVHRRLRDIHSLPRGGRNG
jgi:folylpolyglutamate synthase